MTSLISLLLACAPENAVDRSGHTDVFYQEPSADVDILWVIDDSVSMADEQQLVADGFQSFISTIEETNINFHIGVVTTNMDMEHPDRGALLGDPPFLSPEDDYVVDFQERVKVGTEGSDKEKGLEAARTALTEPRISDANDGFLRRDATLSIIFVSDEDDCSDGETLANEESSACYEQEELLTPVKDYVDAFTALKEDSEGSVLVSGIIGPDVLGDCPESWPGHRYEAVASSMGGITGSICDANYASIMDRMGLAVSGVLTVFQLSYVPVDGTLEVTVDDALISEDPINGWTYDSVYYTIRFDGDFVPDRGSTISVNYEIGGNY